MNDLRAASHNLKLHDTDDALDAMSQGLPGIIYSESDLHPDFFDFKNGLAGEIMQKFVNYGFRVAFVIPADHGHGPRLDELMRDREHHGVIRFFPEAQSAAAWLHSPG